MGALIGPDFPEHLALAVSGGGDSMAMLTLAHNWTHRWGVSLWVVTVDHGLRDGSAAEAEMVAQECALLGHPHATLRWRWDGQGNLQDAARRGRLALIDRWRNGIEHVLMAHTRDDLAETFLMRLARGSGVEGLSAMAATRYVVPHPHAGKNALSPDEVTQTADPPSPARRVAGVPAVSRGFHIVRPCLEISRSDLRHYLETLKGRWVEDPSNDDPRFARVRIRQAAETLEALGLDAATLSDTAARMARAQVALRARAAQVWATIGQEERVGRIATGALLFDRDGFETVERDTQLRLLAAGVQWVSSTVLRPRMEALEGLLDRVLGGGAGTLQGCEAVMERDRLCVFREFQAVRSETCGAASGVLWDGRWRATATADPGVEIRALGEDGWRQVPQKPEEAPPFRSARSLPALWRGANLIACPALAFGEAAQMALWPMGRETGPTFGAFLLSH
ncbi:tRNA lysidine(34) synthetase TilS [Cognatishimia sp. F0-27]|nr:tRNA lysidine(34) synthetase TilS [Cognatishimia sp. F0-27]MCC1493908.1 tRNA lysidine(34) synthetase TilS [Cognatishimia sp. F0-27]